MEGKCPDFRLPNSQSQNSNVWVALCYSGGSRSFYLWENQILVLVPLHVIKELPLTESLQSTLLCCIILFILDNNPVTFLRKQVRDIILQVVQIHLIGGSSRTHVQFFLSLNSVLLLSLSVVVTANCLPNISFLLLPDLVCDGNIPTENIQPLRRRPIIPTWQCSSAPLLLSVGWTQ